MSLVSSCELNIFLFFIANVSTKKHSISSSIINYKIPPTRIIDTVSMNNVSGKINWSYRQSLAARECCTVFRPSFWCSSQENRTVPDREPISCCRFRPLDRKLLPDNTLNCSFPEFWFRNFLLLLWLQVEKNSTLTPLKLNANWFQWFK